MRHFRQTRGKVPIKHASTLVDNTGAGVATIFNHVIYETDVGVRGIAGGIQTIQDSATTERTVLVGDIIKYVNICLQACPRGANPTADNDNCAWLEWAVVYQKERDVAPTVANIGVATLGVICSHTYREDCLMTGCFPIGTKQAMATDIKIKIPKRCCNIKLGSILQCFCYVRTSVAVDMRTDSHRLIASSHFKAYN